MEGGERDTHASTKDGAVALVDGKGAIAVISIVDEARKYVTISATQNQVTSPYAPAPTSNNVPQAASFGTGLVAPHM